jgi:hypothetical protein
MDFLHKREFSFLNRILIVPAQWGAYFTCVAEINLPLDDWNQNPGRHRRSEMKKFLAIVGLLTAVATPAFAQSFSHDFGTGNVIDEPALEQAGRTNANSAFAQAPETKTNRKTRIYSGADSDSPTETGGGSEGYNWNLSHDY